MNIVGNELADQLAKEGTLSPPEINAIPHTDYKAVWKKDASRNTINEIIEDGKTKGTIYFDKYYKASKHPWFAKKRLNRRTIVMTNRLRANHYSAAASLARVNIVDSSRCECGSDCQDANHIIWYCPQNNANRSMLFQELRNIKITPPYDIYTFLVEPNIKVMKLISEFLDRSEIKL